MVSSTLAARIPALESVEPLISSIVSALLDLTATDVALLAASATALVATWRVVYNVLFHPLRHIPGPLLWRASIWPWVFFTNGGYCHDVIYEAHKKYGPVVRVRPDEVSFCTAQAWKDIYALRSRAAAGPSGSRELPRFMTWYKTNVSDPDGIVTAPPKRHAEIRGALSQGFSDRSMQAQESTLLLYMNKLMDNLRARASTSTKQEAVDMCRWYSFTTFDIISDLVYGKSFACLESAEYHEMPGLLYKSNKSLPMVRTFKALGLGKPLKALFTLISGSLAGARERNWAALRERMTMGAERDHDFVAGMLKEQKSGARLTFDEIKMTSTTLIFAGSETTASLLAAVTYLLLVNPEAFAKVKAEVREAFAADGDINIVSVNKLSYMLACLREGLRFFPPVPIGMPRQVVEGADVIDGVPVPAGTVLSVAPYAATRLESNFADPFSFRPERWLGDKEFANDVQEASQPFSLGPRNCIGKNLAYVEMRLILAKLLFNFDIELAPETANWMERQKAYTIWQKPPMEIYLRPVER